MWALPMHATPDNQPEPLTLARIVTAWTFEPLPFIGLVLAAGLYLAGVGVLRRRGDRWPLVRTLMWLVGGLGSAAFATMGSIATYDTVLFSMHMVQHMILTMVTPVFLAVGAPLTLLLRVATPRWRRRIMGVVRSWPLRLLFYAPLQTALMCALPFALYLTDWYDFTLRHGWAHDALHAVFLTMGCLFFWPLVGNDPMPHRPPYALRLLFFLIQMPFHSFLGSMIMGSPRLIAEEWYTSFLRAWPPSPLEDQVIAGAILWAAGDFIMLLFVIVLTVQWVRASQREAARIDRALDREEAALAQASVRNEYDAQPDRNDRPTETDDDR